MLYEERVIFLVNIRERLEVSLKTFRFAILRHFFSSWMFSKDQYVNEILCSLSALNVVFAYTRADIESSIPATLSHIVHKVLSFKRTFQRKRKA